MNGIPMSLHGSSTFGVIKIHLPGSGFVCPVEFINKNYTGDYENIRLELMVQDAAEYGSQSKVQYSHIQTQNNDNPNDDIGKTQRFLSGGPRRLCQLSIDFIEKILLLWRRYFGQRRFLLIHRHGCTCVSERRGRTQELQMPPYPLTSYGMSEKS